jgi:alpha-beta hydrolase superfamily lysophospholipase
MPLLQLALFIVVVQVILRPVLAAWLFTRPPRLRVAFSTPADWEQAYEDVYFTGGGGIDLEGWYIPSRNGAAVVLLHGLGGNRLAVAYHAETLARAGFGVLLFDLRAHGSSGGRRFTRGAEAVEDAQAAVSYLRRRDAQARIGIMGISAGGMLAIQAAARNPAVRAVAADGAILGTVEDLRSPRPPANTRALARIAGRPVLLISAGRGLEQRLTRHFFDAAARPKQIWEIPHAAHATGWAAEPEEYGRVMLNFFGRALGVQAADEDERFADELAVPEEAAPPEEVVAPLADPLPIAERTISPPTAMMIAFATIPAAMLALFVPYQLRWGLFAPRLPAGRELIALLGLLAVLLAGLLLHEAVHLLGYRLFGRLPRGAARLQFGRSFVTPQVQCAAPIRAAAYRRMLLLPALLLGVIPAIVAFVIGSWWLLIWAIWMLAASGGDFAALWAMRGVGGDTPVRAHPRRAGCQLFASEHSVQNIDN